MTASAKSTKREYFDPLRQGRPHHIPTQQRERNTTLTPIMKYFDFEHLPVQLQTISRPFGELAREMDEALPDGPEKSAGLRKLLEAKDCMVRVAL